MQGKSLQTLAPVLGINKRADVALDFLVGHLNLRGDRLEVEIPLSDLGQFNAHLLGLGHKAMSPGKIQRVPQETESQDPVSVCGPSPQNLSLPLPQFSALIGRDQLRAQIDCRIELESVLAIALFAKTDQLAKVPWPHRSGQIDKSAKQREWDAWALLLNCHLLANQRPHAHDHLLGQLLIGEPLGELQCPNQAIGRLHRLPALGFAELYQRLYRRARLQVWPRLDVSLPEQISEPSTQPRLGDCLIGFRPHLGRSFGHFCQLRRDSALLAELHHRPESRALPLATLHLLRTEEIEGESPDQWPVPLLRPLGNQRLESVVNRKPRARPRERLLQVIPHLLVNMERQASNSFDGRESATDRTRRTAWIVAR